MNETIDKYITNPSITIVEAMKKIDENARGLLFVVDENNCLSGSLTDGDIRRWIIKTGNLSASIDEVMNRAPHYILKENLGDVETVLKASKVRALPVLNEDRKVLDIIFSDDKGIVGIQSKKGTLQGVPVIIMAGGKGTRLYPYTKILPKPLIPIGDIPIVERIINSFFEFGITTFFITVNYKKEMIKSYFSEFNHSYEIKYVEENIPLGTGGSIKLITEPFRRPVIVTNCDILIEANYDEIYQYHLHSGNAMTIVAALKNIEIPYGVIHTGEQGSVLSMEEKPSLSYFVNTGMYVINPEIIDLIPENTFFHMTDLAEKLLELGEKIGMYPVSEDSFLDMGEFEEMSRMEQKLHVKQETELKNRF